MAGTRPVFITDRGNFSWSAFALALSDAVGEQITTAAARQGLQVELKPFIDEFRRTIKRADLARLRDVRDMVRLREASACRAVLQDALVRSGCIDEVPMSFVRALRQLAIVEGISTLVLFFVAMPLKYFAGMPMAVTVVGSLHGFLFLALVLMLLMAIGKVPISRGLAAAGVVAAILPVGPFLLERRLARLDVQSGNS